MEENLIKPVNTFAEHSNDTSALENHVDIQSFSLFYDKFEAVRNVSLSIPKNRVTAMIGPSGCGKSTLLRSINRMNDFIPGTHEKGKIIFDNHNITLIFITLSLLYFIYSYFLIFFSMKKTIYKNWFYFILYLCTLEIIPYYYLISNVL